MLDIKLYRNDPEKVRASERKRFRSTENVEKVIEYDEKWLKTLQKLQELRAERNKLSKSFKTAAKEGKAKIEEVRRYPPKLRKKLRSWSHILKNMPKNGMNFVTK